jgi:hypothetical protein
MKSVKISYVNRKSRRSYLVVTSRMSIVIYLQLNTLRSMVVTSDALKSLNVVISALISAESVKTVFSMAPALISVIDAYSVITCAKRSVLGNAPHVIRNAIPHVCTHNAR